MCNNVSYHFVFAVVNNNKLRDNYNLINTEAIKNDFTNVC